MKILNRKPFGKKRKLLPWLPNRIYKSRLLDFSLGFAGACLAAASAYLPWYVHQNSANFQPPQMVFSGASSLDANIDPIITGTSEKTSKPLFKNVGQRAQSGVRVRSPLNRGVAKPVSGTVNPYPGDQLGGDVHVYRILFATPGRALLATGGDVIAVYPGARLPDGSIVKTINRGEGLWQVLDSSGRVFR